MSQQQIRVTFQPHGRAVYMLPGSKVLEVAARAGMAVETPCGGTGTCGKCRVQIVSGACEPTDAEQNIFEKSELAAGWRLACQAGLCSEAVVHVPESSLFAGQHQILTAEHTDAKAEILPAVRKIYVELPEPTLENPDADLLRLEKAVGPLKTDLTLLRQLSLLLRGGAFRGTAVLTDHHLIDFEPGDTTARCYGAAFDIGTTTLVGALLDLRNGEEMALASRMNPQVSFGDDVLSRIKHSSLGAGQLRELHKLVTDAVAEMLREMCDEAEVDCRRVYEASFAGNTTMQHLLCEIPVAPLGQVPFVPTCARGLVLPARDLGLAIHPRAAAYVFPVIGGFVGGDTVAGMLAARVEQQDGPMLVVDIGTNGEIVLVHEGRILAASTAAGPAFEGARISCGMRATTGAIEKVVFDDDVRCSVIGNVAPIGLCGSALVDVAANLLDAGVLAPEGRLRTGDELPAGLSEALRQRVGLDERGQPEFLLAAGDRHRNNGRVSLTQRDIRELQLATGAIRAGIAILLRRAGVESRDLKRILLAGGFGSFIRRSRAQRIGLLPPHVDHSRIRYVGNASLTGAKWALLSTGARQQAEHLARKAEHVELSQDPSFQMEFADAMIFPEET